MTDFIIPQSKTSEPEYLTKGIYLARIINIEPNLNKEGKQITSRNGDPSMRIVLEDQNSKARFTDIMYYGGEKVQWRLDGLMKAIEVDNTQGDVSPQLAIGKEIFIILQQTDYVDTQGNPIMKDNGHPKSYTNIKRYMKVLDRNQPPIDNDLTITKVDTTPQAVAPPVPQVGNSSPF
tara:strand:+ start:2531 stop:3061 length:531 start_codon:yes stop_codon:yes gene_type:complete